MSWLATKGSVMRMLSAQAYEEFKLFVSFLCLILRVVDNKCFISTYVELCFCVNVCVCLWLPFLGQPSSIVC